jgi:GDPmannose 4,6-dehydratase
LARVALGLQECLYLGNLDARRDWGHARDYVHAQWLMLQQDQPRDYVIATGHQHSVREFVQQAAAELGLVLSFSGHGPDEVGIVAARTPRAEALGLSAAVGQVLLRIDPRYWRPAEVDTLLGDASRARAELGWAPSVSFEALVTEMVVHDLAQARREQVVRDAGFTVNRRFE